jgi:hypothetical protein
MVFDAVADQTLALDAEPAPRIVADLRDKRGRADHILEHHRCQQAIRWRRCPAADELSVVLPDHREGLAEGHTRLAWPQDAKLASREQL